MFRHMVKQLDCTYSNVKYHELRCMHSCFTQKEKPMNPEVIHKTADVYGIGRDLPLNYVSRQAVDQALVDNLTRDKHLVIYGSSKQGKTSLRKHCLQDDDYIVIHCSNKWQLADLHGAVLKRAGFELTQSTTRTITGKNKILASFKAAVFGVGVETGAEKEKTEADAVTTKPLELDLEDVNDIIGASIFQFRYEPEAGLS